MFLDLIEWPEEGDDDIETVPEDEEHSGINTALSSSRAKADLTVQGLS